MDFSSRRMLFGASLCVCLLSQPAIAVPVSTCSTGSFWWEGGSVSSCQVGATEEDDAAQIGSLFGNNWQQLSKYDRSTGLEPGSKVSFDAYPNISDWYFFDLYNIDTEALKPYKSVVFTVNKKAKSNDPDSYSGWIAYRFDKAVGQTFSSYGGFETYSDFFKDADPSGNFGDGAEEDNYQHVAIYAKRVPEMDVGGGALALGLLCGLMLLQRENNRRTKRM